MNTIATKKNARIAGLLFLLMVLTGVFAEIFFRQKLFSSDLSATAENILRNMTLYRIGILSDIEMSVSYLFTALALYRLLVSVNKNMAMLMVLFASMGSVLLLSNIMNEYAPLMMLTESIPAGALGIGQLQAMAMLSFSAFGHGYMIGQVFFALWVLPLGVLLYRSEFIPKVFGILFFIEVACGLLSVVAHFLFPNGSLESVLLLPGMVAEISFMLWLLIRGVNERKVIRGKAEHRDHRVWHGRLDNGRVLGSSGISRHGV